MNEETKEKVDVPVLYVNGISDIHYETSDNFYTSIHSAAYKKACGITREIIKETARSEYANGVNNDFGKGNDLRNREQVCNILFFTGEKGTGKTSTMLSFMEFLKDYHRISKRKSELTREFCLDSGSGSAPYMFTGIEYIDASALNDKEDILGNVLSKMLSKWKNEEQRGKYQDSGIVKGNSYDYKKHQLYLQCAEIFDRLKALKSIEDVMENDSDMFFESMESLSFSWNLKKSFQNLVESYLDIMVYPDSKGEINKSNHYLVISIDDVDMNVQSGFMLLEQIRKYLMVPNVLVLMSANYEQLEKICYNHYLKEFEHIEKYDSDTRYMRKISREYLEKMVPVQRQVDLLSNRGWEFFTDKQLQIQYYGENESLKNELNKEGTLCEIVSRCMRKCYGVWFGKDKKCIYHLAPDTVRETCSWVCQISALQACFQDDQCRNISEYEDNLSWFMLSEFPRLCRKYLSIDDCKLLRMLDILEPSGQVELIRDILGEKMGQAREKSLSKLLADAKAGHEDVQNFASLCLIYFNMGLQHLTVLMKQEQNEKRDLGKASQLVKYYSVGGWGIWGMWERDMLAPMAKRDVNKTVPELMGFCRIAWSSFRKDNGCLVLDLEGTFNGGDKESILNYIEKNKEQLKNYQYLLLFYKLQDIEQLNWERNNVGKLILRPSRAGIFSLSGFVLNLIDEATLLRKFQDWLWGDLTKIIKFSRSEEKDIRKKIFIEAYGDLLLPIQNLDFVVSLGAEIKERRCEGGAMKAVSIKKQVKHYFKTIIDYLGKYDTGYLEKFSNYDLVQKILNEDKNFMTLVAKSIETHAVATSEHIPGMDFEWTEEDTNG